MIRAINSDLYACAG